MNAQGIAIFLVALCALSIRGQEERCFDKEKGEAKYKAMKDKCRAEIPKGTEDRKMKIGSCFLKKWGVLSDDMVLDFPKFQEETMVTVIMKSDEIKQKMTECWEGASGEGGDKIKAFFMCYKPAMQELCPVEAEDWKKCEEEDN